MAEARRVVPAIGSGSLEEGVDDGQAAHPREIPIGRPQFPHAARAADRVNAGVMYTAPSLRPDAFWLRRLLFDAASAAGAHKAKRSCPWPSSQSRPAFVFICQRGKVCPVQTGSKPSPFAETAVAKTKRLGLGPGSRLYNRTQTFLDKKPEAESLFGSKGLGLFEQGVRDFNGRLHAPILHPGCAVAATGLARFLPGAPWLRRLLQSGGQDRAE